MPVVDHLRLVGCHQCVQDRCGGGTMTVVSKAITKMIAYYDKNSDRNLHDIAHFMKVWGFAKTIGEEENLDAPTQLTLELAAVVHDIACPLCREKYGNTNGKHQETEGEILAREFFEEFDISDEMRNRIVYLTAHHHTYSNVAGMDYQILLEADFLVNADESNKYKVALDSFRKKVFKTSSGLKLLNEMYLID